METLKKGVFPDCTRGSSTRWKCLTHELFTGGAFKIKKSCIRLDSWVVLAWSIKNEQLFQIGLVDCPCMAGVWLVDCPRAEPQKPGGFPDPLLLFFYPWFGRGARCTLNCTDQIMFTSKHDEQTNFLFLERLPVNSHRQLRKSVSWRYVIKYLVCLFTYTALSDSMCWFLFSNYDLDYSPLHKSGLDVYIGDFPGVTQIIFGVKSFSEIFYSIGVRMFHHYKSLLININGDDKF